MAWFKVDDKIHSHKKVRRLGPDRLAAMGLWLLAGSWCADQKTMFIPAEVVEIFDRKQRYASRLVEVGLWHRETHEGEDGYRFHDWEDYQPSKQDQEASHEKKSSVGRLGNHKRWHASRGVAVPGCPYCNPERDRKPDRNSDRSSDRNSDRTSESPPNRTANPPVPVPDISPSPSHRKSPLQPLGLTEREIKKIEETIMTRHPKTRNLDAFIRTMIKNGDIDPLIADIRAAAADDTPRYRGRTHDWRPDPEQFGLQCLDCPMPHDHPCHRTEAAA